MIRLLAIALPLFIALMGLGCTTTSEPEPVAEPVAETPVAQPTPAPEPDPVAVAERRPAPRQLPKTASAMPLVGLVGLAALGLGGVLRTTRRLRRS